MSQANPSSCPVCHLHDAWCACLQAPLRPGEPVLVSRRPRRPVRGSWGGFQAIRGVVVEVEPSRVRVRYADGTVRWRSPLEVRREVTP